MLTAFCTALAFGLIAYGIYTAIGQLASFFAADIQEIG